MSTASLPRHIVVIGAASGAGAPVAALGERLVTKVETVPQAGHFPLLVVGDHARSNA